MRPRLPLIDPFAWGERCWPGIKFSDEQREIVVSVRDNDRTVVPAGNQLGKDFIAGFICLWWMCSRFPARIVTSAPSDQQLDGVLWGEIREMLANTTYDLPLHYTHRQIRQVTKDGTYIPKGELIAQCVRKGEAISGKHAQREIWLDGVYYDLPRTLMVFDEISAVDHDTIIKSMAWAHSMLMIGNCWPCENEFRFSVEGNPNTNDPGGDMPREDGPGYHRKIIKIRAIDSPNVKLALEEKAAGKEISRTVVIPGILDWDKHQLNLKTWDEHTRCVGIDAEWYKGKDLFMFPNEYLSLAEELAQKGMPKGLRYTLGVDSAMGGDNTAWVVCSSWGLVDMVSMKTPDTTVIINQTLALMRQYNISPEDVMFDYGGGGKPHVDRLRKMGFKVRVIFFGESAKAPRKRAMTQFGEKITQEEHIGAYKNRRAQMYGELAEKLTPDYTSGKGVAQFALPIIILNRTRLDGKASLRKQLAAIPKRYDGEGRMYLPPKNKRTEQDTGETLTQTIGCSPDEADGLVMAVFAQSHKSIPARAGLV